MEILQRLQPLDILFAILWAALVGWGLSTGVVRQIGMFVGVYGAALLAGSLYRYGGQALGLAFGVENRPVLEFAAYVALFIIAFGVICLIVWRTYRGSRISRHFGTDNILGAVLGAVWGVLLLIEHSLVKPTDLSKVGLAFFTINGIISVLLGTLGIIDVFL